MKSKLIITVLFSTTLMACVETTPHRDSTRTAADLRSIGAELAGGPTTCKAARPPTDPDLLGWDPGSRGDLVAASQQGIVVVRYERVGCDMVLKVLSGCTANAATYKYTAYAETRTTVAEDEASLYASFPLMATKLSAQVKAGNVIRADYQLAGIQTLPAGTKVTREGLEGDCSDATHIVRTIHRGAFAMAAMNSQMVAAEGSLIGGELGSKVHTIDKAGDARRCLTEADQPVAGCDVPLRVQLMPLPAAEGSAQPAVPPTAPDEFGTTDAQTEIDAIRERATKRKNAWQKVKGLCDDGALPDDSKLQLLDRFLALVPEASGERDDAEAMKREIEQGPNVFDNMYVSGGLTYPLGGKLEVMRWRWEHFQLGAAMGWLAASPDEAIFAGGGVLGLGWKTNVGPNGMWELGFMGWPLSGIVSWENRAFRRPDAMECWSSGTNVACDVVWNSEDRYTVSLLNLAPYLSLNAGATHLEIGLSVPLIWSSWSTEHNGTDISSISCADDGSNACPLPIPVRESSGEGFYKGLTSTHFFVSAGF